MTRGTPISIDARAIVIRLSFENKPLKIAQITGLNITTIRRIIDYYVNHGCVKPFPTAKRGCKPKLSEQDQSVSVSKYQSSNTDCPPFSSYGLL